MDKYLNSSQLFATSKRINNDYDLGTQFIDELKSKRKFKIKGKQFLVIQCGELNILKNIQSDGNRVEFRFDDNEELLQEFNGVLADVEVFLNPSTHSQKTYVVNEFENIKCLPIV